METTKTEVNQDLGIHIAPFSSKVHILQMCQFSSELTKRDGPTLIRLSDSHGQTQINRNDVSISIALIC